MKKPSVAKPPESTVFFIDRSLGIEPIRSTLVDAGLRVEIHDDHYKRDERDDIWLAEVGRRGWVILTKDQRLRHRPLEKAALVSSGARVFILTSGNLRGHEIAESLQAAMPKIHRVLATRKGPFVARVGRNGRVTVAI